MCYKKKLDLCNQIECHGLKNKKIIKKKIDKNFKEEKIQCRPQNFKKCKFLKKTEEYCNMDYYIKMNLL